MIILSYNFTCSVPDCGERLNTNTQDEVTAYIKMSAARWQAVMNSHTGKVFHYCPDHRTQEKH